MLQEAVAVNKAKTTMLVMQARKSMKSTDDNLHLLFCILELSSYIMLNIWINVNLILRDIDM